MRLVALGIFVTAIIMVLSGAARTDPAPQKQTLPRSFGPLTLGMTEGQFKKIAGPIDVLPCLHCALYENVMSVDIEKYPGVFPVYLYSLAKYQRGLDCSFYKGKLYRIETFPEIKEINAAKKKYTELFGPPSRTEDWPNGLSLAIWENKNTALVLTYVRKQRKDYAYPLTLPVGTVSSVEYIDKSLRDALEAQEKMKPTRQSH